MSPQPNSPESAERAQVRSGFDKPLRRDWPSITPIRMSHHLMQRAQILFMQPLLGTIRRPPNVACHAPGQSFAVAIYSCQRLLTLMAGRDAAIVRHCDVRAR